MKYYDAFNTIGVAVDIGKDSHKSTKLQREARKFRTWALKKAKEEKREYLKKHGLD